MTLCVHMHAAHVYMSIIMLLCDLQSVQALDIVSGPDWLARQFEAH